MTEDWDKGRAINEYSGFVKYMHELNLAVHPRPLQDDMLVYRKNGYEETKMYVVMGVDGMFCEYPVDSYRWYTDLGLHSKLKHNHDHS